MTFVVDRVFKYSSTKMISRVSGITILQPLLGALTMYSYCPLQMRW